MDVLHLTGLSRPGIGEVVTMIGGGPRELIVMS